MRLKYVQRRAACTLLLFALVGAPLFAQTAQTAFLSDPDSLTLKIKECHDNINLLQIQDDAITRRIEEESERYKKAYRDAEWAKIDRLYEAGVLTEESVQNQRREAESTAYQEGEKKKATLTAESAEERAKISRQKQEQDETARRLEGELLSKTFSLDKSAVRVLNVRYDPYTYFIFLTVLIPAFSDDEHHDGYTVELSYSLPGADSYGELERAEKAMAEQKRSFSCAVQYRVQKDGSTPDMYTAHITTADIFADGDEVAHGEQVNKTAVRFLAGRLFSGGSGPSGTVLFSTVTPVTVRLNGMPVATLTEFEENHAVTVGTGKLTFEWEFTDGATEKRTVEVKSGGSVSVRFTYVAKSMAVLCRKKADSYSANKDYKTALVWYERAAEAGDAESMEKAGRLYYEGKGTAANSTKALNWWNKAATAGNGLALYDLGSHYEGTFAYDTASQWYQKALSKGVAGSQAALDRVAEKKQNDEKQKAALAQRAEEKKQKEAERIAAEKKAKEQQRKRDERSQKWDDFFETQRHKTGLSFPCIVGAVNFGGFYSELSGVGIEVFPFAFYYGVLPNIFLSASIEPLNVIGGSNDELYCSMVSGGIGFNTMLFHHINLYAAGTCGAFFLHHDGDEPSERRLLLRASIGMDIISREFGESSDMGATIEYSVDYIEGLGFHDRVFVGFSVYLDKLLPGFIQPYGDDY